MLKVTLSILLTLTVNNLFSQYLHYADESVKSRRNRVERSVPKAHKNPVIIKAKEAPANSSLSNDTATIYHKWPDLCPGLPASIPVLLTYVPKEIVLKLTEFFKGHLYSIGNYKVDQNKGHYKLKVCEAGSIAYKYADERGNLITE